MPLFVAIFTAVFWMLIGAGIVAVSLFFGASTPIAVGSAFAVYSTMIGILNAGKTKS